jgi:hypothetical protein
MTTYTNPFTAQTISPAQVGYEYLTLSADTTLQWPINGNDTTNVAANIIEVTAGVPPSPATAYNLLMPSAYQVSTGQAVIIRNVGANTFNVTNASGATISAVASGVAVYIYLTDNTTANGTWSTVTFGAGTSAANAATLAGYGLTAISTTLNQSYYVQTISSTYTLTSTARAQMNVWTGGVGTITLPSASTVGANWFTIIKNDGTGILTISPVGSDTIDGNANQQLQLTESIVLVSSGSTWYTFGYGRSNSFAYTQLALTLTGGTYTETSAQASNTIQTISGTLTSNQILIIPSTVQLYSFTNNTTGSYSLTIKTAVSGGASITIGQSTSLIVICDGTNVYNAASGSASSIVSLTLGNGSTAVPSLKFTGDTTTGLYLPASGQLGIVISGSLNSYFSSSGFTSLNGISGGTF